MTWQSTTVSSPHLNEALQVIASKMIPYGDLNNGRQTLNIYVPNTAPNSVLIDQAVTQLPLRTESTTTSPHWWVHIHGGAWRDPFLTAASAEAAVAHAFSEAEVPVDGIIAIDYTLSPFPTHPDRPYDPVLDNHKDPSREAIHPAHVKDVYSAFSFLRSLGLTDGSYILSGHSAGSCLAFQSILQPPSYYGFSDMSAPPVPAALIGLNGLYDLDGLVHNLGDAHAHLEHVYENLIGIAFGDQNRWSDASPGRFHVTQLQERSNARQLPPLIVLDQSVEDQLVPVNQTDGLEARLRKVDGVQVVRRSKLWGRHAAPWEEGDMLWEAVKDILAML